MFLGAVLPNHVAHVSKPSLQCLHPIALLLVLQFELLGFVNQAKGVFDYRFLERKIRLQFPHGMQQLVVGCDGFDMDHRVLHLVRFIRVRTKRQRLRT